MPTGYTAGIVDGTIKTFPEFAKLCMRAFGATIHMRDDSMEDEYKPRVPSTYHSDKLLELHKQKEELMNKSDEQLISDKKAELLASKENYIKRIEDTQAKAIRLKDMLKDAQSYVPPTGEHQGIKDFMIQQIEETIKWDGSTNYHDQQIDKIDLQLANLKATDVRFDTAAKIAEDIAYHTKNHNEEIKRCEESNKWCNDFINSL